MLHDVDVHDMDLHYFLSRKKFDVIIFNFPHAGFYPGLGESHFQVIEMHRQLLRGFFASAQVMLYSGGEIHVTTRDDFPYIRQMTYPNSPHPNRPTNLFQTPKMAAAAGARINCFLNPLNSKTTTRLTTHLHFRLSKKKPPTFSTRASAAPPNDPFVLTTPLYYVNAPPHMGSAYTTITADAIARFQRLLGKTVIFITGTDEHGEKIATAAAANNSSPAQHCDLISQSYITLWKNAYIGYDKFIRTTDPKHEAIVKEFYSRVLDNGEIYRADYEGLYCISCEEYKDEKELLENNCCPTHLKPCVAPKEDNFFFALSKYQKRLEETLAKNPNFVQPSYRPNELFLFLKVQSWIKSGLRDFSISRALVDWGIPVPNDSKQTIYVWFDALLGYISALSDDMEQPSLGRAVSSGWPASLHLIGKFGWCGWKLIKDYLKPMGGRGKTCGRDFTFHAVYWPAMLMSAGLGLPKMVFGHGFLTKDGMKMGKSLGNTIEPNDLVHKFGSDAVRYFFIREVEFGSDGDYSEDRFINIVNAHLANSIGNLLNRTLGLLKKNCQSTLVIDSSTAAEGTTFKDTVEKLVIFS
ncbi:hypothetical protein ACLB2K_062372 [Fragaria x ananassa]